MCETSIFHLCSDQCRKIISNCRASPVKEKAACCGVCIGVAVVTKFWVIVVNWNRKADSLWD